MPTGLRAALLCVIAIAATAAAAAAAPNWHNRYNQDLALLMEYEPSTNTNSAHARAFDRAWNATRRFVPAVGTHSPQTATATASTPAHAMNPGLWRVLFDAADPEYRFHYIQQGHRCLWDVHSAECVNPVGSYVEWAVATTNATVLVFATREDRALHIVDRTTNQQFSYHLPHPWQWSGEHAQLSAHACVSGSGRYAVAAVSALDSDGSLRTRDRRLFLFRLDEETGMFVKYHIQLAARFFSAFACAPDRLLVAAERNWPTRTHVPEAALSPPREHTQRLFEIQVRDLLQWYETSEEAERVGRGRRQTDLWTRLRLGYRRTGARDGAPTMTLSQPVWDLCTNGATHEHDRYYVVAFRDGSAYTWGAHEHGQLGAGGAVAFGEDDTHASSDSVVSVVDGDVVAVLTPPLSCGYDRIAAYKRTARGGGLSASSLLVWGKDVSPSQAPRTVPLALAEPEQLAQAMHENVIHEDDWHVVQATSTDAQIALGVLFAVLFAALMALVLYVWHRHRTSLPVVI
jgi:hypothetical protein